MKEGAARRRNRYFRAWGQEEGRDRRRRCRDLHAKIGELAVANEPKVREANFCPESSNSFISSGGSGGAAIWNRPSASRKCATTVSARDWSSVPIAAQKLRPPRVIVPRLTVETSRPVPPRFLWRTRIPIGCSRNIWIDPHPRPNMTAKKSDGPLGATHGLFFGHSAKLVDDRWLRGSLD